MSRFKIRFEAVEDTLDFFYVKAETDDIEDVRNRLDDLLVGWYSDAVTELVNNEFDDMEAGEIYFGDGATYSAKLRGIQEWKDGEWHTVSEPALNP